MAQAMQEFGVDPQTGLAPIQWNSWETDWVGQEQVDRKEERTETITTSEEEIIKAGWINGGGGVNHSVFHDTTTTTTFEDTIRDTFQVDNQLEMEPERLLQNNDNESLGDRVVSRCYHKYAFRNIEVRVTKCKPLTQLYGFFDGVAVTKYIYS